MTRKKNATGRVFTRLRQVFKVSQQGDSILSERDLAVKQDIASTPESNHSSYTAPTFVKPTIKKAKRFQIPKLLSYCRPSKQHGSSEAFRPKSLSSNTSEHTEPHIISASPSLNSTCSPISNEQLIESRHIQQSESEASPSKAEAESHVTMSQEPESCTHPLAKPVQKNEFDTAVANLQAAEKLLHQRHQNINVQPNFSRKLTPVPSPTSTTSQIAGLLQTSRLPDVSPYIIRNAPKTVNEEVVQRRQLVKKLAYSAAIGCPNAVAIVKQIKAHFLIKAQYPGMETCDLSLNWNSKSIHTSQFGIVEHSWINRYSLLAQLTPLVDRRHMSSEDRDIITDQLFPEERSVILEPEYFSIFLQGLSEEGILTKNQATALSCAKVSLEEFNRGAHFTGHLDASRSSRNKLLDLRLFQMPNAPTRSLSFPPIPSTTIKGLAHHLHILCEAAAYDQKYWKGYYFPCARSTLSYFHAAWAIDSEDRLLPPTLTPYKRPWTYRETRALLRAKLVTDLLERYDSGELSDFGIVRIVRATFIRVPAQPYFSLEELESFLYHRITDSGLAVSVIPGILALHPESDAVFSEEKKAEAAMEALWENVARFEDEEKERLRCIEDSCATFWELRCEGLGRWEKVKLRVREVVGRKGTVKPFDPFAPEHEVKE